MTVKSLDGGAKQARRTLSEADISSRRSTPRLPLANSLGASGASASVRGRAPRREHDGAPSPEKLGQDRD